MAYNDGLPDDQRIGRGLQLARGRNPSKVSDPTADFRQTSYPNQANSFGKVISYIPLLSIRFHKIHYEYLRILVSGERWTIRIWAYRWHLQPMEISFSAFCRPTELLVPVQAKEDCILSEVGTIRNARLVPAISIVYLSFLIAQVVQYYCTEWVHIF